MSFDNANNFVKKSSIHVANINRALKNIKLDVIANFIQVENNGIIISTNKVADSLDLQIIKNYIKSTHSIKADQMWNSLNQSLTWSSSAFHTFPKRSTRVLLLMK